LPISMDGVNRIRELHLQGGIIAGGNSATPMSLFCADAGA